MVNKVLCNYYHQYVIYSFSFLAKCLLAFLEKWVFDSAVVNELFELIFVRDNCVLRILCVRQRRACPRLHNARARQRRRTARARRGQFGSYANACQRASAVRSPNGVRLLLFARHEQFVPCTSHLSADFRGSDHRKQAHLSPVRAVSAASARRPRVPDEMCGHVREAPCLWGSERINRRRPRRKQRRRAGADGRRPHRPASVDGSRK